jgi:acetyl-CoA carboxylase carboxyl transferase subunit alpha
VKKTRSVSSTDQVLPFEQPLFDLRAKLESTDSPEEREKLQAQLKTVEKDLFSSITPWERVQLARHAQRPRMLDFTSRLLEDFIELHGDRAIGDDPAMVCGIGRFQGETIFVVGQQKGVTTDEKVRCNFGMAHPEGYRKSLRIYKLAERYGFPIVTFVDTPAAHPGIEAEQYGQGFAIAQNLLAASSLRTPIMSVVLGEGGSGGALGIAVGDWVTMFENAIYVICPPERCAEILWRDVEKKELAASAMRVSAKDLLSFGIIDKILKEPGGGAHRDPDAAAKILSGEISYFLKQCKKGQWTTELRQEKYQKMGRWLEIAESEANTPGALAESSS